jgi:very-short-patch-repair endonuclease
MLAGVSSTDSSPCGATHPRGGQRHNVSVATLDGSVVVAAQGDHAVAALARRQHGMVSYAQLGAAGITPRAIERRVEAGRLHRVHRRVYAVGHVAQTPLGREAAALLACGAGAVLSHRSAGAMWGVVAKPGTGVEVTIVGRDCGSRPGVRHRRVRRLETADMRLNSGLVVTAPARTLLDLGAIASARALRRAVNEALVMGLVNEDDLYAVLDRCRGRRGAPQLRRLLATGRGPSLTRSEAERRLLDVLRARGLQVPETNARVGRYEVDLLWRAERLVVEVDGYAFHATRAAFERDRLRDADLQASGMAVVRVTWRQIVDNPDATVARIARVLESRALAVPATA